MVFFYLAGEVVFLAQREGEEIEQSGSREHVSLRRFLLKKTSMSAAAGKFPAGMSEVIKD